MKTTKRRGVTFYQASEAKYYYICQDEANAEAVGHIGENAMAMNDITPEALGEFILSGKTSLDYGYIFATDNTTAGEQVKQGLMRTFTDRGINYVDCFTLRMYQSECINIKELIGRLNDEKAS